MDIVFFWWYSFASSMFARLLIPHTFLMMIAAISWMFTLFVR